MNFSRSAVNSSPYHTATQQLLAARQRQQSINSDRLSVGTTDFRPPQIRPPSTDCQKICHRWLHRRQLPQNQIWFKSAQGGFWANAWNI